MKKGSVFLMFSCLVLAGAAFAAGCSSREAEHVPEAPDYSDAGMWFVREDAGAGEGADVFYLVSTWEEDWTADDGLVCHYADVYNVQHRADMDKEISRIAGYMGEGNNFYSPYYRHITIEGWATLDEELIGVNDPTTKEELLNIIKPAYIVLKPSLHGGMRGVEEWVRMARWRDIGSWITSALESNVGLNAVAQLAAHVYGDHITMAQGLGTGLLYTDNVTMPIEIRKDALWFNPWL